MSLGDTSTEYTYDDRGNQIKEETTVSTDTGETDFGETTEIIGNDFDNQVCYTGGIHDKETELYYLNARYYDPATGRFISQDTYRGELNDPGQWHLYAYCANNPINYVDPSGHFSVSKYKFHKQNRYLFTITLPWKDVKKFLNESGVIANAIGVAIGKLPAGLLPKAVSTVLLSYGVVSNISSMVIDKYLKNRGIIIKIWFSYQNKITTKYVRKKGKLYAYKIQSVGVYNVRKEVRLGAKY